MRLANLKIPLLLAAALALDLDSSGCIEEADDADDAAQLATADQAIEVGLPGNVIEGVKGAAELYDMIKNLSEFGTPIVTTGDLLEKLDEVDEDIKALGEKVTELQNGMQELMGLISVTAAKGYLHNIDQVMQGWRDASAAEETQPGSLAAFYQNVRNGVPGAYGVIDLATLTSLDDLAQAAIRDNATFLRGQALDRTAELGTYAASVRLRLAEGFYVLSLAMQADGHTAFAPGGTQVKAQTARLAAFDANFLQTNNAMNQAIVTAKMQARQAQFTACYGEYDWGGETQYYAFDDTGTGAHYRYEAGYFFVDTGTCDRVRTSYVYPVPAQLGTKVMGELITAQTAFTGWTQATDNAGLTSMVHVDKATYGGLDVTPSLRSACDGRGACDYTVANLGDPTPNVAKAFEVTYGCGAEPAGVPAGWDGPPGTKTLRLAAEAGGQTVHLTCGAFDGNLARLVGTLPHPRPRRRRPRRLHRHHLPRRRQHHQVHPRRRLQLEPHPDPRPAGHPPAQGPRRHPPHLRHVRRDHHPRPRRQRPRHPGGRRRLLRPPVTPPNPQLATPRARCPHRVAGAAAFRAPARASSLLGRRRRLERRSAGHAPARGAGADGGEAPARRQAAEPRRSARPPQDPAVPDASRRTWTPRPPRVAPRMPPAAPNRDGPRETPHDTAGVSPLAHASI